MFDELVAEGAKSISALVLLLPYIEQDNLYASARQYIESPATQQDVVNRLSGRDGKFSLVASEEYFANGANFLMGDGSVRFIMQGFWKSAVRVLQLGAFNEDWRSMDGIIVAAGPGGGPHVFSNEGSR
jgi:prepilin-type processing-associated H-X9-DG protein